jgi:hypothetical protein
MSTAHTWFCRGLILALLAFGGLAFAPAARADILDDYKAKNKVALQQLEKEIEQAVVQAQQLKAKEPGTALGILNTYKNLLDEDTKLSPERRAQLLKAVTQQIEVLQKAVAGKDKSTDTPPKGKTKADDLYDQYDKYTSKKPGSGGTGASDVAKQLIDSNKSGLGKYNSKPKGNPFDVLPSDIGDIPENGYQSFGKDWKQKTELKLAMKKKLLTEDEAKLIKAMNSYMTLDIDKMPFEDAIKYLVDKTGIDIIIDPNAMKDLMIDYGTPVSLKAKNKLTFRVALKKILGDVGLAYILKGGIVQVVTPQTAQSTMTTQVYSIASVLPPPIPGQGYYFNAIREQAYANQIMQMIVMSVEPSSWAVNGGKGTIMYNPASKSITVTNSAEMHLNSKAALSGGGY